MDRAVARACLAAATAPSREATGGAALLLLLLPLLPVISVALMPLMLLLLVDGRATRWCEMSSPIERRFWRCWPGMEFYCMY